MLLWTGPEMVSRCRLASLPGLAWLALSLQAIAGDNLRYGSIEQVRTRTDARERYVDFEISRGNAARKHLLSYELLETPKGSKEATVKAIDFHREVEPVETQVDALFDRLIAAGIFQLPISAEHRDEGNIWTLFGSLKGHEFQLSYRQPPRNGVRKKVDDAVMTIIREFGLDDIAGPSYATIVRENGISRLQLPERSDAPNPPAVTESEGDLVPARPTTLRWLISHPADFDRKRVSVVGFYHDEFEGSEVRSGEKTDFSENLWSDTISAFAPKRTSFCQDCWVRLDGVFLKGPGGHLGLWPGELTRVTRVEIQKRPSVATARTTR
jgi:hypothetical protein